MPPARLRAERQLTDPSTVQSTGPERTAGIDGRAESMRLMRPRVMRRPAPTDRATEPTTSSAPTLLPCRAGRPPPSKAPAASANGARAPPPVQPERCPLHHLSTNRLPETGRPRSTASHRWAPEHMRLAAWREGAPREGRPVPSMVSRHDSRCLRRSVEAARVGEPERRLAVATVAAAERRAPPAGSPSAAIPNRGNCFQLS